jgi:hypothetical protein
MNLKKKTIICNLFADFILSKIGLDSTTKIQVTDCLNFYTINGETNSNVVININDILDEFNKRFEPFLGDAKIEKTIDMIEYYHNLTPTKKLKFKFFDSTNNIYSKEMLNNLEDEVIESYIYTSTFPYGHSYNMGRTLLYKMKNIAYNVFKTGYIKWVELNLNLNKKDDYILEVDHNSKTFKDERIKSAILDVFDLTDLTPIDLTEDEIFNESLLVESDSPKIKNTTHNFIIM